MFPSIIFLSFAIDVPASTYSTLHSVKSRIAPSSQKDRDIAPVNGPRLIVVFSA